MIEKISTFDENCKNTDPRSSMNLKHKRHEENYIKVHHKQTIQNQGEKIIKRSWKKETHHIQEN